MKKDAAGRHTTMGSPGFNPMAEDDATLFESLMDGEHCLNGFTNRDILVAPDRHTLAARVRSRPEEGQCEGRRAATRP